MTLVNGLLMPGWFEPREVRCPMALTAFVATSRWPGRMRSEGECCELVPHELQVASSGVQRPVSKAPWPVFSRSLGYVLLM